MCKDVIFIRHTAVDLPPGVCYGRSDVPLRPDFRAQASGVRKRLARHAPFGAVYTSPLSRCTLLAGQCGYPDAVRDSRLLELDFGAWELQRYEDIRDPRLEEWYRDYLHVPATGGESFVQQLARVSLFLDELRAAPSRRVAVFAHGGTIACAQVYAGVVPLDKAFSRVPGYGDIVPIRLP